MKFKVQWYEKIPHWANVEADSEKEAIEKMKRGQFIEGTLDSDPGKSKDAKGYKVIKELDHDNF